VTDPWVQHQEHGEYFNPDFERRTGARETNERLEKLEKRLDRMERWIQQTNEGVARLHTALVGLDGQNGLRSEIKKTMSRVDALESRPLRWGAWLGGTGAFVWIANLLTERFL